MPAAKFSTEITADKAEIFFGNQVSIAKPKFEIPWVKPLTKTELDKKMAQGDFEGNVYKSIFSLIKENESEIKNAKPKVSKNSTGYYIWNVVKSLGEKNSLALLHPEGGTFRQQNFSRPNSLNTDFVFDLNKLLVGRAHV
jgi:hypothetical protein